ncbi:MAG: hypothetical protein ABS76_06965 [Pelagibacterium sp. SCN 64-44]|nr:MAG: hypothetical protein ABS76_06965 [Pelagibacterium sp. SCN 64-44]
MRPVRIVLLRRAGFDLQAISHSINGLPAHSVARPGKWGNPFTIKAVMAETGLDKAAAQAEAVARHGRWIRGEIEADRPRPHARRYAPTWPAKTWPAGAAKARPAMWIFSLRWRTIDRPRPVFLNGVSSCDRPGDGSAPKT